MADLNIDSTKTSLIGGLGMTRIKVYENSGCPHFHAITAEAYYVLEGTGKVELHDLEKGFHVVDLVPGLYLQFPPCTVHRLVNGEGLNILGMMGNAGLAENGDARIYFGKTIDEDEDTYAKCVALVSKGVEGALERRDLALKGYQELMGLWEVDRDAYFTELKRFIEAHQKHVQINKEKFETFIANGPKSWLAKTEQRLSNLDGSIYEEQTVQNVSSGDPLLGMCGLLHPIKN